jgi:peptidylprolyl isomerase
VDTGFPTGNATKHLERDSPGCANRLRCIDLQRHTNSGRIFTLSSSDDNTSLPAGTDPENALIIRTTRGDVVVALRNDVAPGHAERLKLLAREQFYDDVPFHRVIDGFMAQTGDGEFGDGTGGSSHPDLKAEFSDVPFQRGTVGMARTNNPHSANSQFFIMFDEGSFLNGQYTVVGEVVHGMDVVDKLKRGEPPADPDRIVEMRVAADAED